MSRGLVVLPVERNILANVPDDQQVVLHHEDELVFNKLAELMDFRNGEIGFGHAISTNIIAEELTETMARKAVRNRASVDRRAVQRSIDRLVKVGLLDRRSPCYRDTGRKRLQLIRVYWRDFTDLCNSVQNPDGTADGTDIDASFRILSFIIRDLYKIKNVINSPDGTADGTQCSFNSNSDFAQQNLEHSASKFPVDMDYTFDADLVDSLISKAGFDSKLIDKRWTASFLSHWWSEDARMSFKKWHHVYCQKMVQYFNKPNLFDDLNGGNFAVKPKLAVVKPFKQKQKDVYHASHREFKKTEGGKVPSNISSIVSGILKNMEIEDE